MSHITKILVVDDEIAIVELLQYNLEKSGFAVDCATDGILALEKIMNKTPDLVILDIMLPGMDGLKLCRTIRQCEKTELLPVIMLSARGGEIDRVLGLEIGADDYLVKPFSPRELVARVKSLLRRMKESSQPSFTAGNDGEIISLGNLKIYTDRYMAVLDGTKLELTPKEFQLLVCLAGAPNKVLSREYLLETVWDNDVVGETRTVDVHIHSLRQQLEKGAGQEFIETIRGIGYRFKEPRMRVLA